MSPGLVAFLAAMVDQAAGIGIHQARAGWMGHHFKALSDRTLMEITLPGSHNSGNYQGALSNELLCRSDYRYPHYVQAVRQAGSEPLSAQGFDELMIPWNINHHLPIPEQLRRDGARFFHLKICNFGGPGSESMDLNSVHFQHRGYTTQETLASTLQEFQAFLDENPHEVVVLGFNNLHNAAPGGFGDADILALARALVSTVGEASLISKEELYTDTLGRLISKGKRMAIFMGGSAAVAGELPGGILPSVEVLAENWDDVMASGDLEASKAWLVKDIQEKASGRERYFVMQANPNNAEQSMFKAMLKRQGPQSNEAFLEQFLQGLPLLVAHATAGAPGARINAVSSDFLNVSKTFEISMELMGLSENR